MIDQSEKISALIITYNEMGYIEKCIDSIQFADEIIVVDSYSTDGTYEYLKNHPKVRVIQNEFENYTAQKSFALKWASHDWVLFLDADEVVTDKLRNEIKAKAKKDIGSTENLCSKTVAFALVDGKLIRTTDFSEKVGLNFARKK